MFSRLPVLSGKTFFLEKNGFKFFKQFYTEMNMKIAARVMQLNIEIPQTILFSNGE